MTDATNASTERIRRAIQSRRSAAGPIPSASGPASPRPAAPRPMVVRAPMDPREPVSRDQLEPGLPSMAAGIGRRAGQERDSARSKLLARPTHASASVNAALDTALDWHPDASYAAWVQTLLGLHEWRLEVNGPDGEPDEALQAEAEAFGRRLFTAYGGGYDAMLRVALDSTLRRGAVAAELDVADGLDDVLDVGMVDPTLIDFESRGEGDHRTIVTVYKPADDDEPVPLSPEQFCYVGIGTRYDQPHGQSPFLPLVDSVYPSSELRDSVQKVAKNHGFARLGFEIDYDAVVRSAPPGVVKHLESGGVEVLDWPRLKSHVETVRADIEDATEDMYVDDTWVYYSMIKPTTIGAEHGSKTFDLGPLAQLLDQDVITSTKGQPAVHGRQWGTDLSSTGSIQWMVQALGIEALRQPAARVVSWVVTQWFRIRGIQATAALVFEPLRKEDRQAEAMADKTRAETVALLLERGLITGPEAREMLRLPPLADIEGMMPAATDAPDAEASESDAGEPGGAAPDATGGEDAGEGRGRAAVGHGASCACGARHDDPLPEDRAVEPFVPDDPDYADAVELAAADPVLDDEDAERVARAFDRWARDNAPAFVGMLRAQIVSSAPDDEPGLGSRSSAAPRSRVEDPVPGRWQWDENLARWRYPSKVPGRLGRLLPVDRADTLHERLIARRGKAMRRATDALIEGRLSLRDWQDRMSEQLRDAHLEARMVAVGGKANMTAADYGAAGGRIGREYQFLAALAQDVSQGNVSEARLRQRVGYRAEANLRETYRRGRQAVSATAGYREELNVLESGAAHCPGCVAEANRGWVPLGTIRGLSARDCGPNCKCRIVYRVRPGQDAPSSREVPA